ncbi:MAG: FKBP-type peptidyl-prolyl cis-trans isomerase, partial [Acidithiobacillus sp.]
MPRKTLPFPQSQAKIEPHRQRRTASSLGPPTYRTRAMIISKDKVVTIDYSLTDEEGELIDSSVGEEPLVYLHGHHGVIPGLEQALAGR